MKFFALLPLMSVVLAIPSLEKRQCQERYLPVLNRLSSHVPESTSPSTTTPFYVYSQIGKTDLLASFQNLPANIYGCTLQFNYVPGKNAVIDTTSRNPLRIDVYAVGQIPTNPTWSNVGPVTGSLVGTFNFPSDLTQPQLITINSFTCSSTLNYRFTVEDPYAIGGVTVDEDNVSGLRIQYNC